MIYLASQSPRRRRLLRRLRRPFRVVRSGHHERIWKGRPPSDNAMCNAAGKARMARLPSGATGIVIGADTFVYFHGRVVGKPKTMRHARRLLRAMSGKSHQVYTGLCLRALPTGKLRVSYDVTRVTFKPLSERTIARLCARGAPLDKAGGYAIQEDRGDLIASVEGSRSNVIGLPLELLRRELAALCI